MRICAVKLRLWASNYLRSIHYERLLQSKEHSLKMWRGVSLYSWSPVLFWWEFLKVQIFQRTASLANY